MNSGTFIILLTATFPTLAILSFLFSLATYFQPLRAHPQTRDRVESLEELRDIISELARRMRDLRRVVVHERQRTSRLESDLRVMARRGRADVEVTEDAGDAAEMHSDNYEEGGRTGSERPTRRDSWTIVFPEEQHIREPAHPTVVGLRKRRFDHAIINNIPVVRIRGGAGSTLDDDDALETASATEIPPSPEHNSSPLNNTLGILTQLVHNDGNEETRARILVDEDTIALSTIWGGFNRTANGFSQLPRPVVIYDHTQTSSPPRHQATMSINHQSTLIHSPPLTISPSHVSTLPPRRLPTRLIIQNNSEELRRTYILTQILENTRPRIRPGNITTIIEGYTRSLADAVRERATSTNGHVQEAPLTHGYRNSHTLRPTITFTDYVPQNARELYMAPEAEEIIRPLLYTLYTIQPEPDMPIITDILARYVTALGLNFLDQAHHIIIRPSTAFSSSQDINGVVHDNGVEDLLADADEDAASGHQEDYQSRLSELASNDEDINMFHTNGGIVMQNPNTTSTHDDEAAERLTARADDVRPRPHPRPRPRLSTPELNEAVENSDAVAHTRDGPVMRLGSEIEDEDGHELHLRRRADSQGGTNGHVTATQMIHPSEYTARVLGDTPESSARSSRSAWLSGTTLVDSAASLGLDSNAVVVPSANVNGQPDETVELYRNNAHETPTASLRRRHAVSNIRGAAREHGRAERGGMGSIGESMDADIAEAEDTWWGLRDRRRDSIEMEMMQHVLDRERAVHFEQRHDMEINGVESEGSEEYTDRPVAEARERGSAGE